MLDDRLTQRLISLARYPGTWMAFVLASGYAFYCAITYSGPYRWLIERQLRRESGEFNEEFALLGIAAGSFVPLFLLAWGVRPLLPRRKTTDEPRPVALDLPSRPAQPRRATSIGFQLMLVVMFLGLCAVAVGGALWYRGEMIGELTRFDVASLEAGRRPESGYLELEAVVAWEYAAEIVKKRNRSVESQTFYCPLVSPDWEPGDPVLAFARTNETKQTHRFARRHKQKLTGVVSLSGLPGPPRSVLEESGFVPAQDHLLLNVGETPTRYLIGGKAATAGGAAVVLLGGLAALIIRARTPFVDPQAANVRVVRRQMHGRHT